MGRKLYVGNFPYETGEADLQDLFARAGNVESVKVMRDMATGRARGFAFVEMQSDEGAQSAIQRLNETELDWCGTAKPRKPQPHGDGLGTHERVKRPKIFLSRHLFQSINCSEAVRSIHLFQA